MPEKSQVVLEEALKSTANERAEVVERLIASLDEASGYRCGAGMAGRSAATTPANRSWRSRAD